MNFACQLCRHKNKFKLHLRLWGLEGLGTTSGSCSQEGTAKEVSLCVCLDFVFARSHQLFAPAEDRTQPGTTCHCDSLLSSAFQRVS